LIKFSVSATPRGKQTYKVSVSTSDKREAAPSGDAWIVLHGKAGVKTRKLKLENFGKRRTLTRGEVSTFDLESKDVGALQEITLGLVGE